MILTIIKEVQSATNIPELELRRTLQSLACAKFKILKKHPPSREVTVTDAFSFNNDFTSPLQKIKISLVSSRAETREQRKETQDRVEEERRHTTEVSGSYTGPSLNGLIMGLLCLGVYS